MSKADRFENPFAVMSSLHTFYRRRDKSVFNRD